MLSNNLLQRECCCNKCLRVMLMAYHNDNHEAITYYNENIVVISVLRIMYMVHCNDNAETITYYNENVVVISV